MAAIKSGRGVEIAFRTFGIERQTGLRATQIPGSTDRSDEVWAAYQGKENATDREAPLSLVGNEQQTYLASAIPPDGDEGYESSEPDQADGKNHGELIPIATE